jgi:hypothetical protein
LAGFNSSKSEAVVMFSRIVSDVFFWGANISLIISVVLLEIGTRYMKKKMNLKRKKADRIAIKFLVASGSMYLLSYLFSLL